jgi:hypothetical protein
MKEFSIVCTESLGHTKTIHEAIVDLTVRPTAVCDGTWQLKGRWGVDATGRVHVHADFVGRAGQIFANSCGCIGSRSNVETRSSQKNKSLHSNCSDCRTIVAGPRKVQEAISLQREQSQQKEAPAQFVT